MTLRAAILLAVVAIGCAAAVRYLATARWPARSPRLAIALWQVLGLTWGVATLGALAGFAVAPYQVGVAGGVISLGRDGFIAPELGHPQVAALSLALALTALLVGALAVATARITLIRRRQRRLLALVGTPSKLTPGALLINHPDTAAYCVPGVRSQIVVSAGTVRLLSPAELDAVLAHERAHASERHDLVLLPFTSLRLAFPCVGLVRRAVAAVDLLIEMAADDRARKATPVRELAAALIRFGTSRPYVPAGALGMAGPLDAPVSTRISRLLEPRPLAWWQQSLAVVTIAVLPIGTGLLMHI